VAFGPAEW
jgi:cilia- and flagella-associated protein 57